MRQFPMSSCSRDGLQNRLDCPREEVQRWLAREPEQARAPGLSIRASPSARRQSDVGWRQDDVSTLFEGHIDVGSDKTDCAGDENGHADGISCKISDLFYFWVPLWCLFFFVSPKPTIDKIWNPFFSWIGFENLGFWFWYAKRKRSKKKGKQVQILFDLGY